MVRLTPVMKKFILRWGKWGRAAASTAGPPRLMLQRETRTLGLPGAHGIHLQLIREEGAA